MEQSCNADVSTAKIDVAPRSLRRCGSNAVWPQVQLRPCNGGYRIEDVIEFEQLAMKKKSMTIREFKNSTPPDKEPTAEAAPIQRLTVEDVVAGLRQDSRLGQGQVQAIPEAD